MTSRGKEKTTHDTIGTDISKERLDAFRLSGQEHPRSQMTRANTGVPALDVRDKDIRVVFELTGAYHCRLETVAGSAGRQLRDGQFAAAACTQAKMDRVDA